MKIKLELFGSSRDFSKETYLEFNLTNKSSVKDLRNEIINFVNKKFQGNRDYKKMINSSAFCSEDNKIIDDKYKLTKKQKIGIIPPIGGG